MRRCKIPTGCKLPEHPCCADCGDKACTARCWNSPERCGCWMDDQTPKAMPRGRKPKFDRQELLSLHKQQLSQREIAQRMSCGKSTVNAALRKLGVKRYG